MTDKEKLKELEELKKACMYSKDNYTAEDRKVLCDGCEEECEFNKKEEPVNDSFEAEVKKLWEEINTGHNYSIVDSYNIFYGLCLDIAEWQKEQQNMIEPVSDEQVKESLIFEHKDKTCKENGNSLTQEPVSEDLEKEIDSYFAKWLQGASDEGCFNPDSQLVSIYDCHRIARHFANWQKQKDKSKVLTEEQCRKIRDDAFELGKDAMKQQMMAKAIDAVVKVDAGGYPYIDRTIELYDYDKDIPLAKRGDKYKVILIKED